MRVLYVDHTAKIGGGEIALANLVVHLDRSLVEPIVLLFEHGPLLERLIPGTETHVVPLPLSVGGAQKDGLGWRSILQLKAVFLTLIHALKVARFIKAKKIEVVHTNSLKADIIGGVAARIVGVPVVWHVRDRIDADYLPASVVRIFRFLSRVVPTFVIANSASTLETLQLKGRRKSMVIGSGVDVRDYKVIGSTPTSDSRRPLIGLVGRISPWKGQHIFIQAAAAIIKKHPEANFQIIGSALFDETDYEDSLHKLCRDLRITNNIEFVGFVNNVSAWIANMDILVHASTTGEPYGQVIIQGMAAGKPVVATNGGGVPEIVVEGITGLLVPMGEVGPMADAIEYILDHPSMAATMGSQGRERVLEHFTIQRTARMVEDVYEQVLHHSV